MRILLAAVVVACGSGNAAKLDAAIDAEADAAPDANADPMLLVACGSNWAGVTDASQMCAAACADHSQIGQAAPCTKAHTAQYDGFQCTVATATSWNGMLGCCLVQPDFAHVASEPVVFAICD